MRRRKSRGTWFPVYDILTGEEGDEVLIAGIDGTSTVKGNGQPDTILFPITLDTPQEPGLDPDASLADIVGSEYLLRRIVGSFFAAYIVSSEGAPLFGKISLGFFVSRAGGTTYASADIPIGAPSANFQANDQAEVAGQNNYSPLASRTMREPWIWRRSWILGNGSTKRETSTVITTSETAAAAWDIFPPSNVGYGSVADGPKVDAKTLRKVGQDDRLYGAVSAIRWPIGGTETELVGDINWHLDYRIFGSLRKARNVGRF